MSRDFKVGDRVRVDYGPNGGLNGPATVDRGTDDGDGAFVRVRLDAGSKRIPCYPHELTHIDPPYAPGDKVRVTFEGTVGKTGTEVRYGNSEVPRYLGSGSLPWAKSIEVIERAKPAWADRAGTVVMDKRGVAWQRRRATGDWRPATCNAADFAYYSYNVLQRSYGPLTLLYDPAA